MAALTSLKPRLALSSLVMVLFIAGILGEGLPSLAVFAFAYLIISYPVIVRAFKFFFRTFRMNEQFLMSVATFGAIYLQDYAEALAIMVFYLIGDSFEKYAAQRARGEITSLIKLKPSFARLVMPDGSAEKVKPRTLKVGDRIRVLTGDSVPVDGRLAGGDASLDMSAMTGESEPVYVAPGGEVSSGAINQGRVFELEVTAAYRDSHLTRLISLIEDAATYKSRPESLITRFAVYYTPVVVFLAVVLALVPFFVGGEDFGDWLERALIFLVISCPCALVLSVPLTFFGGLGAISRLGVMIKGSVHLETLSKIKVMALDKTGTLTKGEFAVSGVVPAGRAESGDDMLQILLALEQNTNHPVGNAVVRHCREMGMQAPPCTDIEETPGLGIRGIMGEHRVYAGRLRYIEQHLNRRDLPHADEGAGTVIHVAVDSDYLGHVLLQDTLRREAAPFVMELHRMGIRSVMLTGDREQIARQAGDDLGVDEVHADLMPQDKLEILRTLKKRFGCAGFVGDGINDGPVLSSADVGIAMGSSGSALAVDVSDVVTMQDDLSKVARAVRLSRRTYTLAIENIALVMGAKLLILVLGALGIAGIWIAILGDVGLLVLSVVNAMRTLTWVKTPRGAKNAVIEGA